MPRLRPCYFSQPPLYWQLFSQAVSSKTANYSAGVFFFQDDYKFERVWSKAREYCVSLKRFPYVASPDFSLYANMPLEMQRWNVYRNRLRASYWQNNGVSVIPTISWSTGESFDFCFDGIYGGTVIISTVGVMRSEESITLWRQGVDELLYRVAPEHIVVYGSRIEYGFRNTDVTYVDYIVKKGGKNYGR